VTELHLVSRHGQF